MKGSHSASAPLIGVTGPAAGIPFAWWATRFALKTVGARPLRLRPGDPWRPHGLDGVVIGGGADIAVTLYDPLEVEIVPPDPERDAYEIDVIEHAIDENVPLLGICRGAQLLNVVLGGNLLQDVRSLRRRSHNRSTVLPTRSVDIVSGSRLAGVIGLERCKVNSLHRQAVDRTGRGISVVAHDLDGIPQGIEDASARFRIGVQWHPEYLAWQRPQRRLFAALARAAQVECSEADSEMR
ncbi:MAG: gamma-glutamyl-gamma-aminobutyrate hydrolase family protein [Gammaproteobacteria bacterium]|nr:MAG: gamma-glutamyl-gamma-aminobutyrate hydrolase family protein [Gammaproteobacteria bacterium]